MNNPLDIALTRIRYTIPAEILEYAFQKRNSYEVITSIDDLIITNVIRPRVAKDLNIEAGKYKEILLRREYLEPLDRTIDDAYMHTGRWSLYRIPAIEREDRPIVEVTNLKFHGAYAGYMPATYAAAYGANMLTQANAVLDAHTFASQPPRPNVELLAGDLVKIWPSQHAGIRWLLCCRLSFDDCFTNLNTSAIDPFATLCVYAVQAYIYNTVTVALDKAYIQGGYALGTFKSIIDSYAEANQKYTEQLNLTYGAMQLDPSRLQQLLPYII